MILKSDGWFIEIAILRRSYPESMDFEDVNWLESEIKINVPGFNGLYSANLRTDDFKRFYTDLERLKTNQSREIKFATMEEGLCLNGLFDVTGNIMWKGLAKSSWGNSCLSFMMETDYASIDDLLKQVQEILNEYPVIRNNELISCF